LQEVSASLFDKREERVMNKKLNQAVKALNEDGIVVFPTDTAFGVGCRIDSEKAMKRLIKIRGRRKNQPFPVLASDLEMLKKYLKPIPEDVLDLMGKYWPGSLTIVLNCRTNMVNPVIRGLGKTLGVRIPNNKTTLELIRAVGVPIIGTSANYPDCPTPFSIKDVDPNLLSSADFVLNGESHVGSSSTVIDC
jgi:L-threonylcarbamoyladenylate synthase